VKLAVSARGSMGLSELARVACPHSRTAKSSPCEVEGCTHYAGTRCRSRKWTIERRICTCCLRRLGWKHTNQYQLRVAHSPASEFVEYENDLIEKCNKLPPRMRAARNPFGERLG
jgi:hypothetical protein